MICNKTIANVVMTEKFLMWFLNIICAISKLYIRHVAYWIKVKGYEYVSFCRDDKKLFTGKL